MLERWEQLDSANTEPMALRVASYLGEGDTAGAKRALAEAQRRFSAAGFIQAATGWGNALWLLDAAQRRLVLRAPTTAFGPFATTRALAMMDLVDSSGDSAAGRRWADSALAAVQTDKRLVGEVHPALPELRPLRWRVLTGTMRPWPGSPRLFA